MKTALYDLARKDRTTTYDFFQWMVMHKILGYEQINFHHLDCPWPGKYQHCDNPYKEARRRFYNYIQPAPHLLGMSAGISSEGEDVGSHWLQDLIKLNQFDFPRIKSPLPPSLHCYTVTLRKESHKPEKNSDEEIWRRFAQKIGALVIEDVSVKEIGLYQRLAYLAGAEMNYGLPNGPVSLIQWTNYPMRMFADPNNFYVVKSFRGHGIEPGTQIPYWRDNQHIVWKRPTLDNLLKEHEAWTKENTRECFVASGSG